jgi:hypothetical protein
MSGFELDSSAINPEADNLSELPKGRLIARSCHETTMPTAWILRSLVVSLLVEGG